MTRWHTDKPVPPVPPVRAIPRIAPVSMFRTTPIARVALATARAFYARKLRLWAKANEHSHGDGQDTP